MLRLTRLLVALSCLVWALAPTPTIMAQREQRLRYGEAVEGTLSGSAAGQVWRFSGNAGDQILIDMRPVGDSDLDTFLTLLDPQGNTLASDDDSGEGTNARLGVLTLRESGDYTILADRYDGAGAYLLSLHNLALLPALALDKPVIGVLDSEHPTDFFALSVSEQPDPALLRLNVRDNDPAGDPILALYGLRGPLISTEDSGSDTLDPLPLAGESAAVVTVSWNGRTAGGAYELWLTGSRIPLLMLGEATEITLGLGGGARYFFQAEEHTAVRLTAMAQGDVAPALTVSALGSSVTLFSSDGPGTRALIATLEIPVTGLYQVDISNATEGAGMGTMTLQLELAND